MNAYAPRATASNEALRAIMRSFEFGGENPPPAGRPRVVPISVHLPADRKSKIQNRKS